MKNLQYIIFFVVFIFSIRSQAQYTWEEVMVPDSAEVKMITFNSFGTQFIATNKGVYYSEDGVNWILSGLSDYVSYIYINENNTIYSGMNKLFRSFDNGITWDSIFYYSQGGMTSLCTLGDSLILLGTWGGIFRSVDSAKTWALVLDSYNSEVFNDIKYNSIGTFYAGSISFLGSPAGGVYRSVDNGATWSLECLEYNFISCLAINSQDDIFVGSRGQYFTGYSGVFKSEDDGINWDTSYSNNLIASMDKNSFDDIAIGCDSQEGEAGGILCTYDGGESWEIITNNLPSNSIYNIKFSPENYLYSITKFDFRLYKTETPVNIFESSKQASVDEIRIFPNPALNYINIQLDVNNNYNLIIFDISGNRKYEMYIDKDYGSINVNIESLSSGLYLIKFSKGFKSYFTFKLLKY